MKAFLQILAGAFQAINAWIRGEELKEAKKDGGRQVENKQMKEGINAAKKAKAKRKDRPDRTKREHLDRL